MIVLLLAGQYESLRLPFVVILVTPLALFGAVGALSLRDLPRDIFGQIGLLLLVGLAAKTAILLVSFARDLSAKGEDAVTAAKGAVPLAIASGASADARISMGTVVIGGLLVATLLTLFVTPVFYVAAERLVAGPERKGAPDEERGGAPQPAE